jgi:hypothetical protein
MGSFRRAILGYRRAEVEAAIESREARLAALELELCSLAEMVAGRDRENRDLRRMLDEANARHDRSLAAVETVAMRLEEIHAQARGQATRIRMKALQDAVQISQRVKEVADRIAVEPAANGDGPMIGQSGPVERPTTDEIFEGMVEVEIGPLSDFSQLVGFEDAAGRIGATSEISVRKFSEGRATISMRLDEPVALLRELEERSPLDFRVRRADGDQVVLDLDDEVEAA